MSLELIRWLAHELRLVLLAETPSGIEPSVEARASLEGDPPHDLAAAVARLSDMPEADLGTMQKALGAARAGEQTAIELPSGRSVLFVPLEDQRVAVLFGPTEGAVRKAMQAKAAAADLAAGVSHEVANALSAIVGWAQVARERPDKAPPEEALALIEKSAQVARDATQDLLRMVRQTNHEKPRTDLAVVIRDVTRLLRPEAQQRRVSIHDATEGTAWVQAKRSQLFSIVWNLAHNAVQMARAGGEVRVRAHRLGDTILLVVEDDGPGMSPEQQQQAFDPYYTTRAEGTGLGLSIVRGTVEALGGDIGLDTSPGYGASFRIRLPAAEQRVDSEKMRPPARISRVMRPEQAQRTHVLVVEDDEGVRGLISMTLALGGMESTCVPTAGAALARSESFSVALIDLTLPDARGDVLLGKLRTKGTVRQAAIMSGGAPPEDIDPTGEPDRWLRKPFDPSDLVECVRQLVESTTESNGAARSNA